MVELSFSCFHCRSVPCRNVPPKHSPRLRFSSPIPFAKRWGNHPTHMLLNSTSPLSSSSNSVSGDFDLVSATEFSDDSVVFRFGNRSEISEKIGEVEQEKLVHEGVKEGSKVGASPSLNEGVENLSMASASDENDGTENINSEVDYNLSGEIESSVTEQRSNSAVVVNVTDQDHQLPVDEKESAVLVNGVEKIVINDSLKIKKHLILDPLEDEEHGDLSMDVAEVNDVPVVSEEGSELVYLSKDVVAEVNDVIGVSEEGFEVLIVSKELSFQQLRQSQIRFLL